MWPELQTDRLRLAPPDATAVRELWALAQSPQVAPSYFLGPLPPGPDAWAEGPDGWERQRVFSLAAYARDDGTLAGMVRVTEDRLSYFLAPRFWGQGLATEAVRAACAALPSLLHLDQLTARVRRDNPRSRRVVEAAGFEFAGLDRAADPRGHPAAVLNYVRRFGAAGLRRQQA